MQPCVLVLAGLDPSGGAGLLADAKAVEAGGARPLCVATALTVQTTRRARRYENCDAGLVIEAVTALLEEENVRAIKIGMIGSAALGEALLDVLPKGLPRVVDPVLRASSGAALLEGPANTYVRLAEGALLTPNLPEAAALAEGAVLAALAEGAVLAAMVAARDAAREAGALRWSAPSPHPGARAGEWGWGAPEARESDQAVDRAGGEGPAAVLVKGGHAEGEEIVDVLWTRAGREEFRGSRIGQGKRGTGCRLASFAAARLAVGDGLREAIIGARGYVRAYLAE